MAQVPWEDQNSTISESGFDPTTGTVASDTSLTVSRTPPLGTRLLVGAVMVSSSDQDFEWELQFGGVTVWEGDGSSGLPSGISFAQPLEAGEDEVVQVVVTSGSAGQLKANFSSKPI